MVQTDNYLPGEFDQISEGHYDLSVGEMMPQPPPMPAGELLPVTIEWRDARGWTNQESPYSDLMRRTWQLTGGMTFYRIQTVGSAIMVQVPFSQQNSEQTQSVVSKNPTYGFAGVFYYKISPLAGGTPV